MIDIGVRPARYAGCDEVSWLFVLGSREGFLEALWLEYAIRNIRMIPESRDSGG